MSLPLDHDLASVITLTLAGMPGQESTVTALALKLGRTRHDVRRAAIWLEANLYVEVVPTARGRYRAIRLVKVYDT